MRPPMTGMARLLEMRALPPPPTPKASGVRAKIVARAGGVLEHHDGVVHYPAYGYGEPCERDDVTSPVYLRRLISRLLN
jgi:hypothetical protein